MKELEKGLQNNLNNGLYHRLNNEINWALSIELGRLLVGGETYELGQILREQLTEYIIL